MILRSRRNLNLRLMAATGSCLTYFVGCDSTLHRALVTSPILNGPEMRLRRARRLTAEIFGGIITAGRISGYICRSRFNPEGFMPRMRRVTRTDLQAASLPTAISGGSGARAPMILSSRLIMAVGDILILFAADLLQKRMLPAILPTINNQGAFSCFA